MIAFVLKNFQNTLWIIEIAVTHQCIQARKLREENIQKYCSTMLRQKISYGCNQDAYGI